MTKLTILSISPPGHKPGVFFGARDSLWPVNNVNYRIANRGWLRRSDRNEKLASQVRMAMTSTQTLRKRLNKLSGDDDFCVVSIIARAPTKAEREIEIDEQLAEMGLTRDHHPGVFLIITEIQSREEAFDGNDS